MEVKVIVGIRGGEQLFLDGHVYVKKRVGVNVVRWKCSHAKLYSCRGAVTTDPHPYSNPTLRKPHTHEPNAAELAVTEMRLETRKAASFTTERPADILASALENTPDEVKAEIGRKLASLKRDLRKTRQNLNRIGGSDGSNPIEYDYSQAGPSTLHPQAAPPNVGHTTKKRKHAESANDELSNDGGWSSDANSLGNFDDSCSDVVSPKIENDSTDTVPFQAEFIDVKEEPVEPVPEDCFLHSEFTLRSWLNEKPDVKPIIFSESSSLRISPKGQAPRNYFNLFFDSEFFDVVAKQTQLRVDHKTDFNKWLGIMFHMGHIQIKHLQHYWDTSPLYDLHLFSENMAKDRFFELLQALRLSKTKYSVDPIEKIQPVVDFFNRRMKEIFCPEKDLMINEPMAIKKGHIIFCKLEKEKSEYDDILMYMLTDSYGIVLRMFVCRKPKDVEPDTFSKRVTDKLLTDFVGKGHSVYTEKSLGSVNLVGNLLDKQIYCTCQLSIDKEGGPVEVTKAELSEGQVKSVWSNDGICTFKCRKNDEVIFVSSEFGPEMTEPTGSVTLIRQPRAQVEYNKRIGCNKTYDLLTSYYSCESSPLEWDQRLNLHIFQIMMLNSFILHQRFSGDRRCDFWAYRHQIVQSVLDVQPKSKAPQNNQHKVPNKSRHLPIFAPFNSEAGTHQYRVQKKCLLCSEVTITCCKTCVGQPGLCLETCFEEYHERGGLM